MVNGIVIDGVATIFVFLILLNHNNHSRSTGRVIYAAWL